MPDIDIASVDFDQLDFQSMDSSQRVELMVAWFTENYSELRGGPDDTAQAREAWKASAGDHLHVHFAVHARPDEIVEAAQILENSSVLLRPIEKENPESPTPGVKISGRAERTWSTRGPMVIGRTPLGRGYLSSLDSSVLPADDGLPLVADGPPSQGETATYLQELVNNLSANDINTDWVRDRSRQLQEGRTQGELFAEERRLRQELSRRLEALERQVAAAADLPPRNHNQPPEMVEELASERRDAITINIAIQQLKVEIAAPSPDREEVQTQVSAIRAVAGNLGRWLINRANGTIDALVPLGAVYVCYNGPEKTYAELMTIADIAIQWIDIISKLLI